MPRTSHLLAALVGLVLLTGLVYWAGLSGPFLFDDTTNILQNDTLRLGSLAPSELWRAAWSLESGPLKRPLAYLSFALDYYVAGSFDAFAFKATNLVIHLLNSLLVAALAWRLGAGALADQPGRRRGFALLAAAIFALHPLALSPVLYVVQRMASLSTLFVLASVLCLLRARSTFPVGAGHARDRDTRLVHDDAHLPTVAVAAMGRSYNPAVRPSTWQKSRRRCLSHSDNYCPRGTVAACIARTGVQPPLAEQRPARRTTGARKHRKPHEFPMTISRLHNNEPDFPAPGRAVGTSFVHRCHERWHVDCCSPAARRLKVARTGR